VLSELGCDEFQGFFLARPMAPERLSRELALADGGPGFEFSPSVLMPL
jgi:EAL domain-containing protein (putative c-di-GMP-specific phosphodiesterase class I)